MKYIVKEDRLYSCVEETDSAFPSCEGDCGQGSHRTWEAAQRCLIKWFNERAKSFHQAATAARKELYAGRTPKPPPRLRLVR